MGKFVRNQNLSGRLNCFTYTAVIHQLTSILTTPKIVLDLGFTAHQTSHLKACIVSQMISYLNALKSPNKILKVAYNKYFYRPCALFESKTYHKYACTCNDIRSKSS